MQNKHKNPDSINFEQLEDKIEQIKNLLRVEKTQYRKQLEMKKVKEAETRQVFDQMNQ